MTAVFGSDEEEVENGLLMLVSMMDGTGIGGESRSMQTRCVENLGVDA